MQTRFSFIRRPAFIYPAGPAPRTAVLRKGLRLPRGCRFFDPGLPDLSDKLRRFVPACIAGSYSSLTAIAMDLVLSNAVIVFRDAAEGSLSDAERDRLWEQFHVPVFEQLLAADGELVASECEAHTGLHLAERKPAVRSRGAAAEMCGCGSQLPRME